MNRFKRRFLVLFVSVIALVVVGAVGIPWLYGNINTQDTSHPGLGIALAAPLLQTVAFPEDEAGFSAYLDVGDAIQDIDDLGEIGTVCTEEPADISDTHLLCEIDDNDLSLVNMNLYADTTGLVVAYLDDNRPTSRAAVWSGDESSQLFLPVFESPTMALDEIVRSAVESVGVNYEDEASNTGYFHWEFPLATVLTVMTKTTDIEEGGTYFFSRPNDPLFEASATIYGRNLGTLTINDSGLGDTARFPYRDARRNDEDIPLNRIGPDVLHKVENQNRIASAIYLLWRPNQ